MISAAQLRAARGLLNWSRNDLARAAKVSQETIKNIEHTIFRPQETTEKAIARAFTAHGVVFTDNEGVRKDDNRVRIFKGDQGLKDFLDDVYDTAKKMKAGTDGSDKTICISHVDERFFMKRLYDHALQHTKRMGELGDSIPMRILVRKEAALNVPGRDYREYRIETTAPDGLVPFYVYGKKLGLVVFEPNKDPHVVVITSSITAKAYRRQFAALWEMATPLPGFRN